MDPEDEGAAGTQRGGSGSLCMGLKPTHAQESKALLDIKAIRSFRALRHCFSKNFGEGEEEKNIIDETHYTIQTHAWQLPAWSSEFRHKNVQHAENPGMGRNNTAASKFKI